MSTQKGSGMTWHQVEVSIRSDIFDKVTDLHLDIRDECNRALAKIAGIDYSATIPAGVTPEKPAQHTSDKEAGTTSQKSAPLRPVMNAEDPRSPAQILRDKKEAAHQKPQAREKSAPVTAPAPAPATPQESLPLSGPARTSPMEKRTKGDTIKKYVKTRIARADDESPDTIIPKDELYTLFERWCREQGVSKIPERRAFFVALKNQYAFTDRTIGQKSCFVNIRMR
ncbi:MAG: hypothetical protein WC391_02270 [Methanoregula sp.]